MKNFYFGFLIWVQVHFRQHFENPFSQTSTPRFDPEQAFRVGSDCKPTKRKLDISLGVQSLQEWTIILSLPCSPVWGSGPAALHSGWNRTKLYATFCNKQDACRFDFHWCTFLTASQQHANTITIFEICYNCANQITLKWSELLNFLLAVCLCFLYSWTNLSIKDLLSTDNWIKMPS